MPYVTRELAGHVVGIFAVAQFEGQEFVAEPVDLWKSYKQRREALYPPIQDRIDGYGKGWHPATMQWSQKAQHRSLLMMRRVSLLKLKFRKIDFVVSRARLLNHHWRYSQTRFGGFFIAKNSL